MIGRAQGLVGLALLLAADPAAATTYFVRASGDDSRGGRSPGAAVASIGVAAAKAGGGDTVVVGPGVYHEGTITPVGNGRRHELMRFVADRDGSMTGDPSGEVLVDASGFENGFRISSRPWVVVNGFSVANASAEGISVKASSDHSTVANCIVFSNLGRGVWVRDSRKVTVFNNLIYANGIYANGSSGIDFGGEGRGSAGGLALNNTIFGNGLDGIRVEGLVPSPHVSVLQNLIAQNVNRGLNTKTKSVKGFVAQWNLNVDGYGSDARQAAFDIAESPRLVEPAGADRVLGDSGHADDDFHLRQLLAGQTEQSAATDAGAVTAAALGLSHASTQTGGAPDSSRADIGFHYGNKTDFVSGFAAPIEARIGQLRARALQCERLGTRARVGRARCLTQIALLGRLKRLCGPRTDELCR
jgi:parallel beta-helix repeat protein